MKPIYIHSGDQCLPGISSTKKLLFGKRVITEAISPERSLGLVTQGAFLSNTNLKSLNAGRSVRKTSERQARWVIKVGVKTWQHYQTQQQLSADECSAHTGLFLGLGTVDCEDDDEPIPIKDSAAFGDYAAQLLVDTKPLAGLTLLNSTTASHIAQLANITGVNTVFSPFADAGGQAIIEAYYAVKESHCQQALVAAGSQKITPWFFLSHQNYFNDPLNNECFPTESSAALVLSSESHQASAQLHQVLRVFHSSDNQLPPRLSHLIAQDDGRSQQVIYTGTGSLSPGQLNELQQLIPNAHVCFLDRLLGYTGPVGALHALLLACDLLQEQRYRRNHGISYHQIHRVVIVIQGHHGQWCFLSVGDV